MCAESPFGRARLRLHKSLSGLRLCHGLRGGCAAPETEAVTVATPLPGRLACHGGGLGCAYCIPPPAGSLRTSGPMREGYRRGGTGASRALARPCLTAPRPAGRRTGDPPPRSGAERPSCKDDSRGSDPSRGRGRACENAHGPAPEPGTCAPGVSLPTTPQAAPAPRSTARRSRKTFPRQRICRTAGAHHRSAKMCIDPHCLLHTSGTTQHIRTPTRFEPPPAGPNSMS
jgi:hypothetical protein